MPFPLRNPVPTATARDLPSQQPAVCFSVTNIRQSEASHGRRRTRCLAQARGGGLEQVAANEGGRERNRGYVVVTEPSSDTPVVMPCKTWTSLSLKQCLSPTSPELVGFFCSSPVQPGSMTAKLSPAMPVVGMPPRGVSRAHDPGSPSVPTGGGVPVSGRSTRYGIICYGG
jgi:hypothetical protein